MQYIEIHNNGGTVHIHPPTEPPRKKHDISGGVMTVIGLGCGTMLAAQMVEAALAYLAAHAVAIVGTVATGAAGAVAIAYRRKIAAMLPARPVTVLPAPVQPVVALPAPPPPAQIQISPEAQQRIAFLRNTGYTLAPEDEAAVERLVQVEARKQKEDVWA